MQMETAKEVIIHNIYFVLYTTSRLFLLYSLCTHALIQYIALDTMQKEKDKSHHSKFAQFCLQ